MQFTVINGIIAVKNKYYNGNNSNVMPQPGTLASVAQSSRQLQAEIFPYFNP